MAIESSCSGCGKKLSVSEEHAGKRPRCPACGQIYTVPYSPATSGSSNPALDDTSAGDYSDYESAQGSSQGIVDPYSPTPPVGGEQFWMRAADGNEYGPVDRQNLDRWFQEGRVGPGYRIRQGGNGEWLEAQIFRPSGGASPASSYAPNPATPFAPGGRQLYTYPKADQSGIILAMGILGLFFCPIFAIVAWIMGSNALKDMQAGQADPGNKGMVQAGYYMGIISVVLNVICLGGYFVIAAIALVAN